MSIFKHTRLVLAQYGRIFLLGGPVGVHYALKLQWLDWRQRQTMAMIDGEKDQHRHHLAQLNAQMNRLVSAQQGTRIAAAQFRLYCDKMADKAHGGVQP